MANAKSKVVVYFSDVNPLIKSQQENNTQWQVFILITKIQSRQQSSRFRGQAFIRKGKKFEIKHKSRCFQKSKLFDWGTRPPSPPWRRLCQDPCFCSGWIGGPWPSWLSPPGYAYGIGITYDQPTKQSSVERKQIDPQRQADLQAIY